MRLDTAIGVGIIGLIAALAIILAAVLEILEDPNRNCYYVTDRAGNEYNSFEPTDALLTDAGQVVVFNTEEDWGFVYGAVSTRADKNCLRDRGVNVPPLAGEEVND